MRCYTHVRNDYRNQLAGGFTIAFELQNDQTARVRQVPFGFTRCKKGDQFTKKQGREYADARLVSVGDVQNRNGILSTRAKTYKGIIKALVKHVQTQITCEVGLRNFSVPAETL